MLYYNIYINDTIAADSRCTHNTRDDNGVGLVAVSYCSAKRNQ